MAGLHFRQVEMSMWQRPWFIELSHEAKLLYLYLCTNPRTVAVGAYEIHSKAIPYETGLNGVEVADLLAGELTPYITYWREINMVFIHDFFGAHRKHSGPNFERSARMAIAEVPPPVREAILAHYPELAGDPPPTVPSPETRDAHDVDNPRPRRRQPTEKGPPRDAQPTAMAPATHVQPTTEASPWVAKEKEKEKGQGKGKESPPAPPAGGTATDATPHRIPDDFAPDTSDYAHAKRNGVTTAQLDRIAEEFVLYWQAATGTTAKKLDWHKALKVRVMERVDSGRVPQIGETGRASPARPTAAQAKADATDDALKQFLMGSRRGEGTDDGRSDPGEDRLRARAT